MRYNAVSLFSSVGIAETYFENHNIHVCVANELLPERARFYKHLYPNCQMVVGDISNPSIFKEIEDTALKHKCDFLIATPPCQGMSTAGKMHRNDPRNALIIYVVKMIKKLQPKFVIIENVPEQLTTKIFADESFILISEYLKNNLTSDYTFNSNQIVNAMNYGIPQSRERCVFLLARKDTNVQWEFPTKYKKISSLEDAIGQLPSLDPDVTDISKEKRDALFPNYENKRAAGLAVSKWHYPPRHKLRHVEAMMHTPEGCTAWDNKIFYPKLADGNKSKGYKNTYKRQWWNKPAYTVTRYTSRLGSQENGHPGRMIEDNNTEEGRIWSDARVLSIFELMLVSSLPTDWNIPEWASSNLIREAIGEGVPPKLIEVAIARITNPIDLESMKIIGRSK